MGYKDITDGDKIAKAIAARVIKSKKGTVGIEVSFGFEEPSTGSQERLSWVGWLSQGAIENSMETLVAVLGYNGSETTDAAGILTDPKVLNFNKEVKLVVENEANPENGKVYPRVKWVNNIGGSGFAGIAPETVKSELQSVGFKAAFLAAKQASGQSIAPPPGPRNHAPQAPTQPAFNDDEIPF